MVTSTGSGRLTFGTSATSRLTPVRGVKGVRIKVQELGGGAAGDVDDLEAPSTLESILLSSVSSPSSASSIHLDRTSRALITPSLKFLWESYRTSLETLKNNARLESIYQSVSVLRTTVKP
ncbi:hypothetical protein C8J55DRAFT_589203 [Lentinula edodes]|uniref:eIF3a PCI domain-containing protein n=1 Tax=Lentinula lateritia TaxID=40482 RepID=A0A9W9DDY8_9AGAR|nr:hypothetical protein C8J55DRAFT_589203 [Lentinula edodes]